MASKPTECLLADGYFVLAPKALFRDVDVQCALQTDFFHTVNDVGKMSALKGITLPVSLPRNPYVFVDEEGMQGKGLVPTTWSPTCPILVGGKDLLPLMDGSRLSDEEIIDTISKEMRSDQDRQLDRNPMCFSSNESHDVGDEFKDFLFGLFPDVSAEDRQHYMIYMINTLHGSMHVARGDIYVVKDKSPKEHVILESITRMVEDKEVHGRASFIPYYRKGRGIRGNCDINSPRALLDNEKKRFQSMFNKAPIEVLTEIDDLFSDKIQTVPCNGVVQNLCASDVYKVFPRTLCSVDLDTPINRTLEDYMKLYESILLNQKLHDNMAVTHFGGSYAGVTGGQINKRNAEIVTLWCLGVLYTAIQDEEPELRDCEYRLLRMRDAIERKRRSGASVYDIVDDSHASIIFNFFDERHAVHMRDFNINGTKVEDKPSICGLEKNMYVMPTPGNMTVGMSIMGKIFAAVGFDTIAFAQIVRFLERDVLVRAADLRLFRKTCICDTSLCVHRLFESFRQRNYIIGTAPVTTKVMSSSEGMQKRTSRKRKVGGTVVKNNKKEPHIGGFISTLRCTSSRNILVSPFGSAAVVCQKEQNQVEAVASNTPSLADGEQNNTYRKSVQSIVSSIIQKIHFGLEDDIQNASKHEKLLQHVGVPDRVLASTMAPFSTKTLCSMLEMPDKLTQKKVRRCIKSYITSFTSKIQNAWNQACGEAARLKCEINSTDVDKSWTISVTADPHLDQYDCISYPLFARTMFHIILPLCTVHVGMGTFVPTGQFPRYDKTNALVVFGEKKYRFDGTLDTTSNNIVHAGLETDATELTSFNGPTQQSLAVTKCVCKSTSKFARKSVNTGQQNESTANATTGEASALDATDENKFECILESIALKRAFTFENTGDEDTECKSMNDMDSNDILTENELLIFMKNNSGKIPSPLQQKCRGLVIKGIIQAVNVDNCALAPYISSELDKHTMFKYTTSILDVLCKCYTPSSFNFSRDEAGLSLLKFYIAYVCFCRYFKVPITSEREPTFTLCGFVGSCDRKTGERIKAMFYNYNQMQIVDAPLASFYTDYSMYPASFNSNEHTSQKVKSNDKLHGGPIMKKCDSATSASIRAFCSNYYNNFTKAWESPFFILMSPSVSTTTSYQVAASNNLRDLSIDVLLDLLVSGKNWNVFAQSCNYETVKDCFEEQENVLCDKFITHLNMSDENAQLLARTAKSMYSAQGKECEVEMDDNEDEESNDAYDEL